MKNFAQFNKFNENDDYDEYRKHCRALIEPIEKYIEDKFDVKDQGVEVKIYYENMFSEEVFTISVTYPFPDTYNINDIDVCLNKTLKNIETLKNMKQLEKDFDSSYSSNDNLNKNFNRFKFYVLVEKMDSDFFKSIKGLGKYKL